MTLLPSMREVLLIDGRTPSRELVAAQLYRDCPATMLEKVEQAWASARIKAAAAGQAGLEHDDWDWRNKEKEAASGRYVLIAVEREGEPQGIMAVSRLPAPSRLDRS